MNCIEQVNSLVSIRLAAEICSELLLLLLLLLLFLFIYLFFKGPPAQSRRREN